MNSNCCDALSINDTCMMCKEHCSNIGAEVINDIADNAKKVWKNNYSDKFNYVTDKIKRINNLVETGDNPIFIYNMFDLNNKYKLMRELNEESRNFILNNN